MKLKLSFNNFDMTKIVTHKLWSGYAEKMLYYPIIENPVRIFRKLFIKVLLHLVLKSEKNPPNLNVPKSFL